jgi:hypothetical protein
VNAKIREVDKPSRADFDAAIGARLPVKDALRSIRFGLKRGRRLLDPMVSSLPGPLGNVASRTLLNVDSIGSGVDRMLSGAAHRLLDHRDERTISDALVLRADAQASVVFAQIVYQGLRQALRQLGAGNVLISERSAAEAFRAASRTYDGADDRSALAATLLFALLDAGAVEFAERSAPKPVAGAVAGKKLPIGLDHDQDVVLLALFAVMLWMQIDRGGDSETEDELLALSCDVTMALRRSIVSARDDRAKLADLLSHYARAI